MLRLARMSASVRPRVGGIVVLPMALDLLTELFLKAIKDAS